MELNHWRELGKKDRASVVVYSQQVFAFMRDTPDHQEVVATLTNDNCTTLIRRDK